VLNVREISQNQIDEIPLCVDLDGTLVNTDTLVESAVLLVKRNSLYIFAMIFWLFSGKAHLKEQIASRIKLDVSTLPYNKTLLEWLRAQRTMGRDLVLVTATNYRIAEAIAHHLQLFSRVIASTGQRNMGAGTKRDELTNVFGEKAFDYVGNSRDDLAVWSNCRKAVLVNTSRTLAAQAAKRAEIEASFPGTHGPFFALLKAMRPHQWSKNLLVFVSILIAQNYTNVPLLLSTIVAFISFCLCSSAVYLINDLLDLEADRRHAEKCNRPFASGQVPLIYGVMATPILLIVAVLLAWNAGGHFFGVLVLYFGVTLVYSFYLKRLALLDVLVLASLYTLRIIAGAAVAAATPSVWLISFSMFIFTSLAMAKRYAELKSLELKSGAAVIGRGYHVSDITIIAQLGAASGYISVLVLALYIDSHEVIATYQYQSLMWLLCPLLMYWIGRIWLVASRGQLHQDPVIFATRDRVSYIVFGLGLLTIMAAL
jgi:4-hydroxybenzoate polyprenyltransferase/phosphoserine phosphatase